MVKANSGTGQGLVIVALAMTVVLAFLGLGIDLERYMKRRLQTEADAAAPAGATELSHGGGASDCNALITAAEGAKEQDYAVLATEIARRKGRRQTPHVEIRSGLKATAF
jgi:uncharacterized membrane protein